MNHTSGCMSSWVIYGSLLIFFFSDLGSPIVVVPDSTPPPYPLLYYSFGSTLSQYSQFLSDKIHLPYVL